MSYSVLRPMGLPPPAPLPRTTPTVVTRGTARDTFGRTLLVVWFVVGMFGGVTVMKSSFGHSPTVQHVVKQIRALVR